METDEIIVLDEGVTVEEVAESAACCTAGTPNPLRTAPPPSE